METKIKYLWLMLILPFSGINFAISQEYTSTSKEEFLTYIQEEDAYYQNLIDQKNGSTEGIDGYKSYNRWKTTYYEDAYNNNGMYNVLNGELNFNMNYGTIMGATNSTQIEWEELGPVDKPIDYTMPELPYIHPAGVGRIFSVEFDPQNSNRVFIGSPTGGLYYSSDHGETWQNGGTDQLPNPGISHFKLVPETKTNDEAWFILTGDADNNMSYSYGIFRSTDQGQNWNNVSNGISIGTWTVGRKLLFNSSDPNEMIAIFNNGLYKTTNALVTNSAAVHWDEIDFSNNTDEHCTDICYMPNSNYQTIYVSNREGVFQSSDGGDTYFPLPNQDQINFIGDTITERRITLRTTPANEDILYVAIISNSNGSETLIYKYNSVTEQWTQKGMQMPYWEYYNNNDSTIFESIGYGRYQGFEVSPSNENILYKSRIRYVDKSDDGGETWQHINDQKHDDTHWICFENNDPTKMWLGTDGGVYYTENELIDIVDKTYGVGVANLEKVATSVKNHNMFLVGAWDCGTMLYKPEVNDWGVIRGGDGLKGMINDKNNDDIYYHCSANVSSPRRYNQELFQQGEEWWEGDVIGSNGFSHAMVKDYYDNDIIYYPGKYRVGRSYDNAVTWESISPLASEITEDIRYRHIESTKYNRDVLYVTKIRNEGDVVVGDFQILKTENCRDISMNVIWQDISPTINGQYHNQWCGDIAINGNNTDEIWATYGGFNANRKVLHYDGNQWNDITDDPNNTLEHLSVSSIDWIDRPDNMLIIEPIVAFIIKQII